MIENVPRIGFFVHTLDDRAVSSVSLALAREMIARGGRVTLICATRDAPASPVIPPGVEVVDLGIGRGRTSRSVARLARWLRSAPPDVLFAQDDGPGRAAVLARDLTRAPTAVIVVLHRHYSAFLTPRGRPRPQGALRDRWTGWLLPRADRVAGVSPGVAEDIAARFPALGGRVAVLPDPGPDPEEVASRAAAPVDHPWFHRPREHRLVVSVANVIPRKGQDVLVEALPRVRENVGDVRLALIGRLDDAAFCARLERRAAELGVLDSVGLLGFRPDPLPFVARGDAFALASRNEGLGLVLIEAMACGVPAVATDCPSGPAWLLEEGRAGRLVPMDDPAAMADALRGVLTDDRERAELAARGRERARAFAPASAADAWLRLARECREERARRP